MCGSPPGTRCASDTRDAATTSAAEFEAAHPNAALSIDPVASASSAFNVSAPDATSTNDTIEASNDEPPTGVYTFDASRAHEAVKRIEKANKRLERAGIAERFTYTTEEFVEERTVKGVRGHVLRHRITLNHPELSYGGWTFVAAVDHTKAGAITRVAPGQSLNGWRPEDSLCEHCGKARHRTSTYIVQNENGERRQVGSGCMEGFLGVRPQGLWAMTYDLEEPAPDTDSEGVEHASSADAVTPTRDLIATALAVSDGGKDYWSQSAANMYERESTSSATRWAMIGATLGRDDAREQAAIQERAKAYLDDGTADEVLRAAQEIDGDNDYATNMRVIASGEWVSTKHTGLAVSAIGVWNRARKLEIERKQKAESAKGFIAAPKEKVADVGATITKVRHIEQNYGYRPTTGTLILMRTADGHEVKWFSSRMQSDVKVGQEVRVSGTVKANEEYQGVDQTVLTRAKLVSA